MPFRLGRAEVCVGGLGAVQCRNVSLSGAPGLRRVRSYLHRVFFARAPHPFAIHRNGQVDKLGGLPETLSNVKTMTVAEFKTRFSEVLEAVKQGESIAVTYGRSKRTVAIIRPPVRKRKKGRSLGMLRGKVSFEIPPDFEMSESELLKS